MPRLMRKAKVGFMSKKKNLAISHSLNEKQKKEVKKLINVNLSRTLETKYYDIALNTVTGYTPSNAGTILPITGLVTYIAQGNADQQRVGDSITPIKYEFRGEITGNNLHTMRIIVFQWHPNYSDYSPSTGDILNGAYASSVNFPLAHQSWDYRKNFTVLADRFYVQDINKSTYVHIIIPKKKLVKNIEYIAGSQSNALNHIFMMFIQDGTTTLNTIYGVQRLYYKDA